MKTIDRYIIRQIWPPMLLACALISVVTVGGVIQEQIRLVLERVPLAPFYVGDLTKMFFYALPTMSGYIVPVTFLLGLLLAFGQMAQRSELIALKAAGVPLKRVLFPVVITGAIVSGACFLIQDFGQPWAFSRMMQLVYSEVPLRVTIDALPENTTSTYGDWSVHIGKRDADGTLHDIVVMQPGTDGGAATFYADTARLLNKDGVSILEMRQGVFVPERAEQKAAFEVLQKAVPVPDFASRKRGREEMGIGELLQTERGLSESFASTGSLPVMAELAKYRREIAERTSFPFMCLAVTVLAAPIGARSKRSGRSYTFLAGAGVIVLYFVAARLTVPTTLPSLPLAIAQAHAPNLALILLGAVLTWRVDRV